MEQNTQLGTPEDKQQVSHTNKAQTNPRLRYDETQYITLEELKRFSLMKFGSYSKFGQAIGTDRSNAKRILDGVYTPKKISTMNKIAEALGLPPIIISRMFAGQKQ